MGSVSGVLVVATVVIAVLVYKKKLNISFVQRTAASTPTKAVKPLAKPKKKAAVKDAGAVHKPKSKEEQQPLLKQKSLAPPSLLY